MLKKSLMLIIVGMMLYSCYKVPVTGRKQFRMLPESMLLSMSITAYNDFLKQNPPMSASNADASRVKSVGQKMAQTVDYYLVSNGFKKIKRNFSWNFELVNNPQVNAWCMPGGKIVFYSGIMPLVQNDAGIAVVMGHEMAHAVARHGNERMSQQLALYLGGITLAVAMNDKPEETRNLFLAVYGVGGALGDLAYSRNHEYEADKIGMVFMALAGYNPEEAITFWERMSAISKGPQIPQFLSTHPHHDNRIVEMKKFLPKAQKFYKPS
jgi:predicted Zn-dependent protease